MSKACIFVTILTIIGCSFAKREREIFSHINIDEWKKDTCGISNRRYNAALKLLSHKDLFLGIKSDRLKTILGAPDFIREYNIFKHPNTIQYEYSTSSMEIVDKKCGDPITHSICFIISKKSNKVIGIEEFIY